MLQNGAHYVDLVEVQELFTHVPKLVTCWKRISVNKVDPALEGKGCNFQTIDKFSYLVLI